MNLERLTRPEGPWLHLLVATPADLSDAVRRLELTAPGPAAARVVRGGKATTAAAFFDECAAAWQFPLYFGENWDATLDCLSDLSWLRAGAYVFCVADAGRLLEGAPAEEAQRFLALVNDSASRWNRPEQSRPARPFHVVFHAG